MQTTSHDLPYAISHAIDFEEQPPLYFAVLWCWRQLNETIFWGRMLSAACTVAFLAVCWRIAVHALPKIHPVWIVAPLAAHPIVVYAASEMRAPGLTLLLPGLLVWLFMKGFSGERPNAVTVAAYGLVSVIALYTYYYLGFLLLAHGVALLFTRRWRAIALYYGLMMLVAAACIPVFHTVQAQRGVFDVRSAFGLTAGGGTRLMVERVQGYLLPSSGLGLDGRIRWVVPGILAMAAIATLFLRRKHIRPPLVLAIIVTLVTGAGLAVVAWQLGWRSMLPRHAVPVLVLAYVCAYGLIKSLRGPGAWTDSCGMEHGDCHSDGLRAPYRI
jgi:hypothetical protein